MPIMYQNWIERDDLRRNYKPGKEFYYQKDHYLRSGDFNRYYLFGDNLKRAGLGGQAKAMRGEPNAIGIATKRGPSMNDSDMWIEKTPEDAKRFIASIDKDMEQVLELLDKNCIVVVPTDGLGTGLSMLPTNAPITNDYLTELLFERLPKMYGTFNSTDWEDHLPPPSEPNELLVVFQEVFLASRRSYSDKTPQIKTDHRAMIIAYKGRVPYTMYGKYDHFSESNDYELLDSVPPKSGYWVLTNAQEYTAYDEGSCLTGTWRRATQDDFKRYGIDSPFPTSGE